MKQLYFYYILVIKIILNCSPLGHSLAVILRREVSYSVLWLVYDFPCKDHRRLSVGRERVWFKLAQMTWIPLFWQ